LPVDPHLDCERLTKRVNMYFDKQ